MDEQTDKRLTELYVAIEAGTSLLTKQDVAEALMVAMFPRGTPLTMDSSLAQMLKDHVSEGTSVSDINCELLLSTLEERLRIKEGRS
ncbi:MAG: hypothetical protein JJE16_00465 [Nitrospiraceae bacterium]|nr:hypothetical protein [Nitrospiraceae bacterium]